MTKSKGAFVEYIETRVSDMFEGITEAIKADITGIPSTWKTKYPHIPIKYLRYEVIKDFEYNHRDQDVNHGKYTLVKGQIVDLRSDQDPVYFMPDRSNLKFISEIMK